MTSSSEPEVSFTSLVLSLATTAAVHFGDVGDPTTGARGETNLAGARQMIEILGILQEKTRGNLTPDEAAVLEQVLYELRLRFVDADRSREGSRIITP
jgi:hypothetical protein